MPPESRKESNTHRFLSLKVKEGDQFPNFKLMDHLGDQFILHEQQDKKYRVLYFYPKDETPGCTRQACYFRDYSNVYEEYDCEIIGISSDNQKSHEKFIQNYDLPFRLLSDDKSKLRKELGIPKDFFGLAPGRVTFLLNAKHEILFIFRSALNMKSHITSVLNFLDQNK